MSLQSIIDDILIEENMYHAENADNIARVLRRNFSNLIERMGGDKTRFKLKREAYTFSTEDVSFIKAIVRQLYEKEGLVAKLMDKRVLMSSRDIRNFIQSIIDAEDNKGTGEDELIRLASFLNDMFFMLPQRTRGPLE